MFSWFAKRKILETMNDPQPLPMGVKAFHDWSDRIIQGACIPGATPESLKFALAAIVMHLKPTEDHCADGYFIKTLRKGAVNEVMVAMMNEFKAAQKKRDDEAKLKAVPPEVAQAK